MACLINGMGGGGVEGGGVKGWRGGVKSRKTTMSDRTNKYRQEA